MRLGTEPLNKTKSLFNYSEENPTINLFFSINPLSFTVKLGLVRTREKTHVFKKKKCKTFKEINIFFEKHAFLMKNMLVL